MRSWNIEIWLLDDQGNEVLPTVYEKAVYNLHPSFDKNKQSECAACAGPERLADGPDSIQKATIPHRRAGMG